MNEIERKLSIMGNRSRRTRRVIVTIAIASLLVATAMLVGASLLGFYYKQTVTIDIEPLVTITDPNNVTHDAGWEETFTIGTGVYFPGNTYIYPSTGNYTITLNEDGVPSLTFYFHVKITEDGNQSTDDGILITIKDGASQILVTSNGIGEGQIVISAGSSDSFTIHITIDPMIDTNKLYEYTLTIDNIQAPA